MAISDSAAWTETELSNRKAVVADTVLAITQLAHNAGGAARGSEMKAAGLAAGDKGTSLGSESHEGENTLHVSGVRTRTWRKSGCNTRDYRLS